MLERTDFLEYELLEPIKFFDLVSQQEIEVSTLYIKPIRVKDLKKSADTRRYYEFIDRIQNLSKKSELQTIASLDSEFFNKINSLFGDASPSKKSKSKDKVEEDKLPTIKDIENEVIRIYEGAKSGGLSTADIIDYALPLLSTDKCYYGIDERQKMDTLEHYEGLREELPAICDFLLEKTLLHSHIAMKLKREMKKK